MSRRLMLMAALGLVFAPTAASAQINFQKTGYYVAMGDSVAAGEGAMPVTNGYAYQLYERGVFGQKQEIDFANVAVRGGRSWDLRDHQVPQVLCAEPARPTVVTITAGASDFLRGDQNIFLIASRVAASVTRLLHNGNVALAGAPILDPFFGTVCRPLSNVTILVSNYYNIPHPDPTVKALLDAALQGFDNSLRFLLPQIPVPTGSRVVLVDLYTPSLDREGLVLVERRLGFTGLFNFEVHPTNLGHAFIAKEFEKAWQGQ